jgi:adenosylcobinamide-GDP ribazoletransferase
LRAATSFLTRLRAGRDGADDIARGVPWFPIVGCVIGVAAAGVYAGGRELVPSFVAAVIAIGFCVWVTGAFHEDGLADTFDALGGVRSREETLRVMKDPRLGTYGVAAFTFSVLVRVGSLAALDATSALAVLPAAHALSRAGAVALLRGPVATDDGLGASYASSVSPGRVRSAVVAGLAVGVIALGPVAAPAVIGVAIAAAVAGRTARSRIGGVTGDVLGAAQQGGEIVVLLVGLVAARQGWFHVPWW